MKFKFIPIVFALFCTLQVFAVTDFSFDNNTNVPTQWTSIPSNALTIGTDHFTDGKQALKWDIAAKSAITINIENEVAGPIIYIPVYSTVENNDTLKFRLYAADHKTVLRETNMLLCFKGWREFHRHYLNDFGKNATAGKYQFVEITFLKGKGSTRTSVWFDGVRLSVPEYGIYATRYAIPYFKDDYDKGFFTRVRGVNTECMDAFANKVLPVTITPEHRKAFEIIRNKFSYQALGGINKTDEKLIAAAKDTVGKFHISFNADGSVKGIPIARNDLSNAYIVRNYTKAILNLSIAAQASLPDLSARDSLIKFTRFLLDRGLAEGGATYLPTNNYDYCRKDLWMGWVHALPLYRAYDSEHPGATLTNDVLRWLKWIYYYGTIYREDINDVPGDYINVASRFLFVIANNGATTDEQIRDYLCAVKFYEKWSEVKPEGWSSGIKIDGSYFHHGSIHNGYSQCMGQWVNDMSKMKNTIFNINKDAYFNISKGILTELLESATKGKNAFYANTLTGRGPFSMASKVTMDNFAELIRMGGYAIGQPFEPTMAAAYNYLSKDRTFDVEPADLNGFHQRNYGSMGIYRGTKGWVATMRGMTSTLWGSEVYNKANRFGRYQSHGVLEVLYNQDPMTANSGYPKEQTWDWNVVPGATVVRHTPDYWYTLQPTMGEERANEFQKKDFVGALSNGKNGIFAMDFEESSDGWHNKQRYTVTDNLKFKKSVFAFNDLMVCLGSNIEFKPESGRKTDTLATNLFQFVFGETEKLPFYWNNSDEIMEDMESKTTLATKNNWLISPAGTGYFMPKQNASLHIICGTQNTPPFNVESKSTEKDYENALITSDVSKAWISHSERSNNKYEFVVIPKTTPKELKTLSSKLGSGKGLYEVLRQDSVAHIVKFTESNLIDYAIFEASTGLPGILKSVSAPCLVMVQTNAEKTTLSVCSPDLNYKADPVCKWMSEPKTITLEINTLLAVPKEMPSNVTIVRNQTSTLITVILKDGLSTQINF
ncbi:MAG: polysaccharide lyase family 8 super-sandwich domain-containing protein [Paludibacter sp.]